MRGWRIHQKLLLLALGPAVIIAVTMGSFFILDALAALDAQFRGRGLATVRYLAPASEYGVISGHGGSLTLLTKAAMQEPDARAVLISDAAGQVLAYAGDARILKVDTVRVDAVLVGEDWLGFSAPILRSTLENDRLDAFDAYFDQQLPTPGSPQPIVGRVYVEFSTVGLQQRRADLLQKGLMILFGGLLLAAFLALRIARGVSRPVMRLAHAVKAMESGQLATRVEESSEGELAILEKGFNRMAVNLQEAQETLSERIEQATAQLAHQARHDALTGLVNRREFELRVERAATSAIKGAGEHLVGYLDLDQFKVVNDTCGHAAGDELLRQISVLLKARVRSRDTLARLGGDEFGVLIENCPFDDALGVVEALRQLVEEFRFSWGERVFAIGVSIGVVRLTHEARTLAEVLGAADEACYQAKEAGRNRIVVYRPPEAEVVERRSDTGWSARISAALADQRLRLFAQSIVPLAPGAALGVRAELLLRMVDEAGRLVPPRAFLPAAERYGYLPAIERWVVAEACRDIRQYIDTTGCHRLLLAINLSTRALEDPGMLSWIRENLAEHRVPARALCIEISESAASQTYAATLAFVQGLRSIGCQVALKNFGRGMASFSYLKNLLPDYVKIDGGIIRDVADHHMGQTLVSAVQQIATEMGLHAVAESVDTPRCFAALRERGLAFGQGYWFDHPKEFDGWLADARVCGAENPLPGGAQVISYRDLHAELS